MFFCTLNIDFPLFFLLLLSLINSFDTLMVVFLIRTDSKKKMHYTFTSSIIGTLYDNEQTIRPKELIFTETFSGEDKIPGLFLVMSSKVVNYLSRDLALLHFKSLHILRFVLMDLPVQFLQEVFKRTLSGNLDNLDNHYHCNCIEMLCFYSYCCVGCTVYLGC